ncbi:MAG: hypothetical protein Q8K32_09310 [Archangium sp.]|nr:hypothetical protein [Archangium sp.]
MSGLNDEQFARFEQLSNKPELDDAEMGELEQLDGLTRETSAAPPLSPSVAPSVQGFTADDVSNEVIATEQTARNTKLRLAFDESQRTTDDDAATTLAIAKQLGVPFDNVRQNLPAFKETAKAAQFDPDRWATENPQLAKLVLEHPDMGPLVLRSKDLGPLVKAVHQVGDWFKDAITSLNEALPVPAETLAAQKQAMTGPDFAAVDADALDVANTPLTPDQLAARDSSREKRDAPKQVLERDDPKARVLRDDPSMAARSVTLVVRAMETAAQLDISRKNFQLMLAENGGPGNADDIRAELHDAKLKAQGRAYGDDSGLMRDLSEAVQGGVSTIDVLGSSAKGAGAAATVGAVGGGIAGGVATKTPAGALEGAAAGARLFAGTGAKVGAAWATFNLEAGSTYGELRDLETDGHRKLTPGEAAGGAVIAGLLKSGLEMVSLGQSTKVLKGALPSTVTGMLKTDPTFRRLAAEVGVEWFKSVGTEAVTEGAQNAVDQLAKYFAASMKDKQLQRGPAVKGEEVLVDMQAGAFGAMAFGTLSSATSLAFTQTQDDKAAAADRQVGPLLELANQPAVRAAPSEFAAMITEASAENGGAPVTALHVDASAVVRFFQDKGQDADAANATVAGLLGPEAPAKLLEAASTGGKLEVPLDRALSAWGSSELGKALVDDTTTDANGLSPRQRKEREAEITAEKEAIVAAETAKLQEQQVVAERTAELEQQLVDSGLTKEKAKASAALVRVLQEVQASDFGKTVSQVFPESPVSFAKGDEQVAGQQERVDQVEAGPLGSQVLTERFNAQVGEKAEERVTDFFIDTTTGALNKRAFERIEPAGRKTAVISVEGIKYANDNLGHDAGNAVYRSAAQALAPFFPELAKVGGDFAAYVKDDRELAHAIEQANKAGVLEGYRIVGAVGSNVRDAAARNNKIKRSGEKAGTRSQRGKRPKASTSAKPRPLQGNRLEGTPISPALRERLAKEFERKQAEQFAATFVEPGTGLLTKDGFDRLPRKRFHITLDLNGIAEFNSVLGDEVTDRIIEAFGRALTELGAEDFDGAHVSGDEYEAQSDSKEAAEAWLSKVDTLLRGARFELELTGDQRKALNLPATGPVGLSGLLFGRGVGETVDDAEHALQADKQRLTDAGERGPGRAARRIGDLGGPAQAEGSGTGPREGEVDDAGRPNDQVRRVGQRFLREVDRLRQDNGAVPKGYTELPAGRALQSTIRVFLNKSADVSTVLHESGHAFLEQLFDLAERPDAPQRTKDTAAAALKALGVDSRKEVKREQHEKFARAFEAYVMEGKAPSAALKRIFARFTRWLVQVYRTIAGIPGAELSAELRPVFDALLATEDQLAAARRAEGPKPTAEQLAVTEQERAEQREQEADDYTEGSHAAQLAAVKDALRVRESWWKKGLKKLEANFNDEYEALPARRAQRLLIDNEVVLDRAAVEEVIGTAKFPGLRTAEEGGTRPSVVAELAGYASPRAMLAELAGLRSKEAWSRDQAESEMRRLHPGILDDAKKFRGMLADGLRSATEKRLSRELKGVPREALKRAAPTLAGRRLVSQLNPNKALGLQRQAAHAKARAMAKGDAIAAGEAARAELLNHFLFHELRKAEAEMEKVQELAKSLGKTTARERLGKASPTYRDAVDFLLSELGLGEERPELDAGTLQQVVDQMNGDAMIIGDPEWLGPVQEAIAVKGGFQKLTVDQARAVSAALKNIKAAANQRTTVLVEGQRVDRDQVKAAILQELASILPAKPAAVSKHARTVTEKVKAGVNAIDGMLTSPVDMFRELTGDNQESMTWKAFVNPMRRATIVEADLLKERVKPVFDAFAAIPKDMRKRLGEIIDGRALFPQHAEAFLPRRRYELLGIALNAGNASNLKRLTEGRDISEQQVKVALDELSKEEIAWVNAVHESVEALREPSFDLEERETGLRPKAIEAKRMVLKNGTLEGGYFPLKAEPDAGTAGLRAGGESELASLFDPTFTRPGTSHGHLKGRASNAKYVVALDPDILRKHLQQVTRDLAFREAVKSAGSLIMDGDIQGEMQKRLGAEKAKEPLIWLKDIGGGRGTEVNAADNLFSFVKRNMSTALLSGLSTAMSNWANLPAAVASTKLTSRRLAAGLYEVTSSPRATRAMAMEKSGILRSMDNDLLQGLSKELTSFRAGDVARGMEWTKEAGMAAMRTIDGVVSTAVWTGAYRQALAEGKEEGAAVRWADDLLLQVQPSSSPVEKARILREKGFVGGLTMFYGYLSVAYRAQHRLAAPLRTQAFRNASPAKKAAIAGKVAGSLLGFYMAYSVLGELGAGRGPEDGDRDEEEPSSELLKWRNWFARKMLIAPFSTLPVIPVSQLIEGQLLHKRVNPRADPLSAGIAQLAQTGQLLTKAIAEGEDGDKATRSALQSLGLATGLPVRLLNTTGGYLVDVLFGDREVPNPGRFVGGVIYGERDGQPDNLPAALGDGLDPLRAE